MAGVTTAAEFWWPILIAGTSVRLPYCGVCGRSHMLEQHHCPPRSAGVYVDGRGIVHRPPTFTLCGFGNSERYGGEWMCHGLWHSGRLHIRWVPDEGGWNRPTAYGAGEYRYLLTREPMGHAEALEIVDGWRRFGREFTDVQRFMRGETDA